MDILKAKRVLRRATNDGVLSDEEIEAVACILSNIDMLSKRNLPKSVQCYCSDCIYAIHSIESLIPYELEHEYYSCGLLGGERIPARNGFCSFGKSRESLHQE